MYVYMYICIYVYIYIYISLKRTSVYEFERLKERR